MTNTHQHIKLTDAVARHPDRRLAAPASIHLSAGQHLAIVGPNGSGKTLLVDMLTGKSPLREGSVEYFFPGAADPVRAYGNIVQITFEDALGSVERPYYFQQRFNSQDSEESPLLRDLLEADAREAGATADELAATFGIAPLLDKRLVLLSSGEMRRYQLFRHLIHRPRVLIVDNPFIGLDAPMRQQLDEFFRCLVSGGEVQLVIVLPVEADVPDYITHVVSLDHLVAGPVVERAAFVAKLTADAPGGSEASPADSTAADGFALHEAILRLPTQPAVTLMRDGSVNDEIIDVRHLALPLPESSRVLFGGLDWTVRRGEMWALRGPNGSGKSTLLSLICADHPAAYSCDISLFGRRRGTGESIWDIKRHIGFVSPEFHRAYRQNRPAIDIVASGLFDTVGLYRRANDEQLDVCRFWMRMFRIEHLAERMFLTLSSGEQRLCLLARAFVKDPALLILDEPLHGLDVRYRELVRHVVQTFCRRADKTLVYVTHYPEELPAGITHTLTL